MTDKPNLLDKCSGALLSSAIGDALGWPYERRSEGYSAKNPPPDGFQGWSRHTGGQFWPHTEYVFPGEYSDDTQMIISIARSIVSGDWVSFFTTKELPYWLSYERGGGSALKAAARSYKQGVYPWQAGDPSFYFNAGGNGAVMRILPHVIYRSKSASISELMADVVLDGLLTHGHPRAILGASSYAYALWTVMNRDSTLEYGELVDLIIQGVKTWGCLRDDAVPEGWLSAKALVRAYSYDDEWEKTLKSMLHSMEFISSCLEKGLLGNDRQVLHELKCFQKEKGAGDVAVLGALYLASKYANNPMLAVKNAAYTSGIDTDTIASITGGLLGMLSGPAWIPPEWQTVQDRNCIIRIAEILLSDDSQETSKRISSRAIAQNTASVTNSVIGKLFVLGKEEVPAGKTGRITITKVQTLWGQTLYCKKYSRLANLPIHTEVRSNLNDTGALSRKSQVSAHDDFNILNTALSGKQFVLNSTLASQLSEDPLFSRVSFKKVLQILTVIFTDSLPSEEISKRFKVEEAMVEKLKRLTKD